MSFVLPFKKAKEEALAQNGPPQPPPRCSIKHVRRPRVGALMATELHRDPEKTSHEIDRFQNLACGYILEG
ncbi:MAG: hypothetical protein B7Z37_18580 [Verrucomicrobia bacterium 12-59-8]|nr:MAG: hypothetical protein B7Z37_18580 [Verrucomicrobia bacterium 12-59-8]